MAGFPSLPLFVKDYLIDTTALTLEQSGAYLHLLMHAWSRGGTLPDCDRQLAAFTKCSLKKWRAIRPVLEPYFTVAEGRWINARLSREWKFVRDISEKRAAAGARGSAVRHSKNNDLSKQMPDVCSSKTLAPTPTPTPTPIIGEPDGSLPPISPQKKPRCFELPEWVPEAEWAGFLEMRRKIRRPCTDRAKAGIIRELRTLRDMGHAPGPVLDQSTRNAWLGVFPLKEIDIEQRGLPANRQYRRDPAWERFCQLAKEYAADPDGFGREADEGDEGD